MRQEQVLLPGRILYRLRLADMSEPLIVQPLSWSLKKGATVLMNRPTSHNGSFTSVIIFRRDSKPLRNCRVAWPDFIIWSRILTGGKPVKLGVFGPGGRCGRRQNGWSNVRICVSCMTKRVCPESEPSACPSSLGRYQHRSFVSVADWGLLNLDSIFWISITNNTCLFRVTQRVKPKFLSKGTKQIRIWVRSSYNIIFCLSSRDGTGLSIKFETNVSWRGEVGPSRVTKLSMW